MKCTGSYCAECPSIWFCIIFAHSSGYIFWAGIAQKWCVLLSASHRTHMVLFCPIIEDVNCDHLVKMMSDRFLHVKVIPFVICKWSVRKYFSSVQFSHSVVSDSLWPHESQHARPPCPSPTPGVYPNPCPLSWWCHLTISSSVVPFASCPQSCPASGSFPMRQLFASGGHIIAVSVSTSVFPMNTQDWSPSGWTGWISLQSRGLSRVFSNTTVQKHQFFGAQLSSQSNPHIHTWPQEKP